MDMGFSCRTDAFFPGVHKIGAPISGPRIADTNFTDTRIFLIKGMLQGDAEMMQRAVCLEQSPRYAVGLRVRLLSGRCCHEVYQQVVDSREEVLRIWCVLFMSQRAQRSKKIDLDRNFQSRSQFFDLARKFQSRRLDFPTKNRAAVGGSLENFILDRNFQSRSKSRIFLIFGPSGVGALRTGSVQTGSE